MQKLKSMWAEATRLVGVWSKPHSIRVHWRTACGEERVYFCTDGRPLKDGDEWVKIKTDTFDRLWGFITYYILIFVNNVFNEARCTHPHESCFEEWEGDSDVGYCRQTYCHACGGYTNAEGVDRFRAERHPELVSPPSYTPRAEVWDYDPYEDYDYDYDYDYDDHWDDYDPYPYE